MNWIKIEEKYPKSWKLINDTDDRMAAVRLGIKGFSNRFLFDIFDEQRIIINVFYTAYWTQQDESEYRSYFSWDIYDKEYNNTGSAFVEEPTRTEAETPAFEKAFEILENKLEQEK